MLKELRLANLTVFSDARFSFGKNLNVIVGENGLGKTHLLKAAYTMPYASARGEKDSGTSAPTKAYLQGAIARKLRDVFKPDELGRLARRHQGVSRCEVRWSFLKPRLDCAVTFNSKSKTEVTVEETPAEWTDKFPVYLPPRELLTIYPGFVSLYETTHTEFDATWRDTCLLLGAPLARGPREAAIRELLEPLETAMGGKVELDKSGRFYLNATSGRMEMHLVAEGLRKLAMIARLIATGSLLDKGYLFWDEPEANLNPRLIAQLARTILAVAQSGIQVFLATHSLFLLRELEILHRGDFGKLDVRFFGLHAGKDGATVEQGPSVDDIGSIAALDEQLAQSDRFLDAEAHTE